MQKQFRISHWFLLTPVILLLAYGNQFLYLSNAEYSDLVISHLPNVLYLREALLTWHRIPLWSPAILSGYPFVANPLSGVWYLPGWFAVLWPEPWLFNLLAGLHLAWGGLGVYRLLRKDVGQTASIFGALAFAWMPKLFAHFGAGHVSLLYAVSWTPWLLVSVQNRGKWGRPLQGIVLGMIFFADVRWAVYAGGLWILYLACSQINLGDGEIIDSDENTSSAKMFRKISKNLSRLPFGGLKKCWLHLRHVFGAVVSPLFLAGGLTAPFAFPLLEYTRLSTRAGLDAVDVLAFSLPPARLLGLFFPDFGGLQEWVVYPGVLVILLTLMGGVWADVRRRTRFWWGVLLVTLVFSLGENIPGMAWVAKLPGLSLLRVPPRALFLAGLAFAMIAAHALDRLLMGIRPVEQRWAIRVMLVLGGGMLAITFGVWGLVGSVPFNFVWGAGTVVLSLGGVGILLGKHRPPPAWMGYALLGISLLDWAGVNVRSLSPRPAQVVFSEGAEVAEFLSQQEDWFRVYSPSYSLPQQTAARFGLELADGVDPVQLQAYADFMEAATGIPREGYSVTMPPFAGDVSTANAGYSPDAAALGTLNVRYVAAEFDLEAEGLVLLAQFGETRVYENILVRPRAWVEGVSDGRVNITAWSPNRLMVQADGPGHLVLSEIAYPGWRVRVDGEPASLVLVDGLLRGVDLSAGSHLVIFDFWPVSLVFGWIVFGITILLGTISTFWRSKNS